MFTFPSGEGSWYRGGVQASRLWASGVWLGTLLALGLGLVSGCGELSERARFDADVGTLEIVATDPPHGATDVDPRALENFDALLHSGTVTFDGRQEVQLFSWRASGSRTELAATRWCPGSVLSLAPGAALQPGLGYRVEIRPAPLGWAGEALDTEQDGWAPDPQEEGDLRFFLEFRVAGTTADERPEKILELEPGPTLTELFEPGEIFDPERAACSCHQQPDELAFARLDLTTPTRAFEGLVLRQGLEATDFPMISPRRPSESYLIHKLIRTDTGERLHALRGEPMPPDAPIPHADLTRIAHWIHAGAEL